MYCSFKLNYFVLFYYYYFAFLNCVGIDRIDGRNFLCRLLISYLSGMRDLVMGFLVHIILGFAVQIHCFIVIVLLRVFLEIANLIKGD